jgi:hypothetical protein
LSGLCRYFSYAGKAYIFYGGSSMNNTVDVTMTGETLNNFFGYSVSSAGDVNGDGYSDVIVGAVGYSLNKGRAYIFFGGSSMNNTSDVTMTGETTNIFFGGSVSSAGDVNGDGYSDVIVGSYGNNSFTGRAYVYFGGTNMNIYSDVIMNGETTDNEFGKSVSTAGDVNGDGYSDVIVGANRFNTQTGRAYVYYGGIDMNNIADVTMTGENTSNFFGYSVSFAGDVNGDGYSDVIVGAHNYNVQIGRAYVYFGGTAMNNIADVIMTGEANLYEFGYSVSSAGDINGDGYSDLIVGSRAYNTYTGRAYIYNGSAISANPILNYVKDVPNDQGGKLNLKWARSANDVQGNTLVTDYLIQRSFPPTGGNFSWQNVTTIPASHESFYTYIDNTPSDSTSNGSSTFFFRITARTNDINQTWRSNILSGRSIDNIAPLAVSAFTATNAGANVNLNWGGSSAPDLLNYILYRSTSPTIDPYLQTPLATSTSLTYTDTSPISGLYYYFILAQDIHGNYSPVSVTQRPAVTLNLTMLIQGFYNSSTDLMVRDTSVVYLRSSTSPYAKVDSAKAYLSNTGAGNFYFTNAANGVSYYLQLKQRNTLETWSKITQQFAGSILTYNFTSASSQAYGNNMINVDASPVRYAVYSGDVNQNGYIDLTDVIQINNAANTFASGYVVTDLTGNNIVDLTDVLMAYNNATAFVSVIRP